MVLPKPYTTASPILTNFDYSEVANGLGYEIFYALRYADSTSTKKTFLSSTPFEMIGKAFRNAESSSWTSTSSQFNITRTVSGTAIISASGVTGGNPTIASFKLQRWDGTTATDISSTHTSISVSADEPIFIELPLIETKFNVGDALRVIIGVAGSGGGLNATVEKPLSIHIPFKLDL